MLRHVTRYFIPFILTIFFFAPSKTYATHIMGGNITYSCVGTDSFLIRLSLYRDCKGITMSASQTIQLNSPCGQQSITLNLIPGSGNDITPLCPGFLSPCAGGSILPSGVEEYIYEALWVVPSGAANCQQFTVSWESCCRNSVITTGPADESFYIATTLNRGGALCNNSPQFLNPPVPFVCIGNEVNYNHGVSDPDGDSLSFSLVNCKQTANTSVTYLNPLTATTPLFVSDSVRVDPKTGTITFTPSIAQIGVLCIKVDEFRNGVKIGEAVRDIQIIVVPCQNDPPAATSINDKGSFDTAICPGQTLTFDVFSNDSTPFQTVTMRWNAGIPGASFTVSGGQYPVGTFNWTPSVSDIGFHFFTVTVLDDGCPIVGQNTFAYSIEVREPRIDLGPDLAACNGDTVSIQSVYTSVDFNQFTWQPPTGIIDPSVAAASFAPSVSTTYTLSATNGFCNATDTITVNVDQRPVFSIVDPGFLCRGDSVNLTVQGNGAAYTWSTGESGNSIQVNPLSSTFYQVTATSAFGCESFDTFEVQVVPLPLIDAGPDNRVCPGGSIELQATGSGIVYEWLPNNLVNPDNAAITTATPDVPTTFTVVTRDANGCVNFDTVVIGIHPLPAINAQRDTTINYGGEATLSSGNLNAITYNWAPPVGLVPPSTVADETIIVSPLEATTYTVTITDANGCVSVDSVQVDILPGQLDVPTAFTPNGDGLNDKFEVLGSGTFDVNFFRVYNRWGQLVFETMSSNPGDGWDGTFNGEPQGPGVYTWVFSGREKVSGEEKLLSGNVTLIR